MARGKVKCRIKREKRGQWRVYDVTQVTYEIILSTLGDLRASCAVLARRWLAFHITFATFAARTRLFSTLAHVPLKYTNPLLTYPSFLFFPPYRVSTIARTPAFRYLLFAGTFVRRSDHHHYSSRTHLRDTAKRPRDDTAFLRARAYIVSMKAHVSCRTETSKSSRSSSRGIASSIPRALSSSRILSFN